MGPYKVQGRHDARESTGSSGTSKDFSLLAQIDSIKLAVMTLGKGFGNTKTLKAGEWHHQNSKS